MTARTAGLHAAILNAIGRPITGYSDLDSKPFDIDVPPLRFRIYAYSLVGGAGERPRREFKIVLRVPGQEVDAYGSFSHVEDRFTLLVGYSPDLDVFVLWDATLHPRFKAGGNLQVRDSVVWSAAAEGVAEQVRNLTGGVREVVFACRGPQLWRAVEARVAATGGLEKGECATFLS